ncbi:MAG: bifunctional oligoribonuclease/PAP phosphatase NrnA [Planctomycetes bacterium]|nr:bifunctional oligoribonuclease/PAP phosphatase NrnA [Planctomycetota bacterium]
MTRGLATDVEGFARFLNECDRIILTTHMTPDGDGLGSELALYRFLKKRDKDVRILNCSSVPPDLRFLTRSGEVLTFQKGKHEPLVEGAGSIIAFDLGGAGRLGRMEAPVRAAQAPKALLDHHIFANDLFDLLFVEAQASSSAELTYRVIKHMGGKITQDIAEPLYIGIVQDTGSFNYNSTSPYTHRMAAEFLEAGVNPYRIWKKLHCQKPFDRVRLMGLNIARIDLHASGRVAALKVDLEFLKQNKGEVRDAFEVVNHFLSIQGVDVGCLALQIGSEKTKFSLRSAGTFDVHAIAAEYGGGGHRFAAGFTVDERVLSEIYDEIVGRLVRLVRED